MDSVMAFLSTHELSKREMSVLFSFFFHGCICIFFLFLFGNIVASTRERTSLYSVHLNSFEWQAQPVFPSSSSAASSKKVLRGGEIDVFAAFFYNRERAPSPRNGWSYGIFFLRLIHNQW